ncbi:hypothetical protein [Amycolatopsis antarctica]|uniref:hypothetical protein n=1 Tax=Amycolatopsis antarctica TaxID=1854586 RepID=UPI0013FE46FA|nr:hypothetical protein [Amycolatopsis antarctica]
MVLALELVAAAPIVSVIREVGARQSAWAHQPVLPIVTIGAADPPKAVTSTAWPSACS